MPVINIAMHPVSAEEKQHLIAALTRTAAETTRIPESSFIVFVDEFPDEAIGIGGRTLKEIHAAH